MANELAKFLNSRRRHQDENAVKRQKRIADSHGFPTKNEHRLSKVHATTCGDSNCVMCGNPRKFFGEPTVQEKRMYQDADAVRDTRSNGLSHDDTES